MSMGEMDADRLVEETFKVFDLDGDGFISMQELKMMISGDGPLVEVLPDGQTVEQIMAVAGNDQGLITFSSLCSYLSNVERRAKGQDNRPVRSSQPKDRNVDDLLAMLADDSKESAVEEGRKGQPSKDRNASWLSEHLAHASAQLREGNGNTAACGALLSACSAALCIDEDPAELCARFATELCLARSHASVDGQGSEELRTVIQSCLDLVASHLGAPSSASGRASTQG